MQQIISETAKKTTLFDYLESDDKASFEI